GSSIAAMVAVPLERWLGSWQATLASWGIPEFLAVAAWYPVMRRTNEPSVDASAPPTVLPSRNRAAWLLASIVLLRASIAYAYIAWLAPAYEARWWSEATAGALLAVALLPQLPAAIGLPAISDRWLDRRPAIGLAVGATVIGAFWLLLLPETLPWVAASILG